MTLTIFLIKQEKCGGCDSFISRYSFQLAKDLTAINCEFDIIDVQLLAFHKHFTLNPNIGTEFLLDDGKIYSGFFPYTPMLCKFDGTSDEFFTDLNKQKNIEIWGVNITYNSNKAILRKTGDFGLNPRNYQEFLKWAKVAPKTINKPNISNSNPIRVINSNGASQSREHKVKGEEEINNRRLITNGESGNAEIGAGSSINGGVKRIEKVREIESEIINNRVNVTTENLTNNGLSIGEKIIISRFHR
jgi:hypothetical protein